jgi:predicted peptidase
MGRDLIVLEAAALRYLRVLPDDARDKQTTPRPLLCFLHGYGEAAPLDIDRALTRHGPLRPGNSPLADDFIVVAPQLPSAGDAWWRYGDNVNRIIDEERRALNADSERIYLTGFSYGGNGVLDLALQRPDFYAALWAVDPTRVPSEELRAPLWLSFGEVARRAKNEFIRALELRDAAVDRRGDRLYLDQGLDHVGAAAHAYRDDRVYSWLLSKSLGSPRGE